MDGRAALVIVGVLIVGGGLIAWALRGRWDLIMEHGRDAVRHLLAALLMLGTLAGTVWTFSNGSLSISGIWESLVSVGGVAAALELGVIYCGIYLGDLDARIHSARRDDQRRELKAQRRSLNRWFYGVAAISATANVIFRTQQLHSFWLALLPAGAPIVLVILFAIKLRPLPKDYAEIGRQGMQRGLVLVASQAQANMLRSLRRIGRGHLLSDAERAQLAMSISLVRIYASGEQQQALDHVIAQQSATPQLIAGPTNGNAGEWLTSADIVRLYSTSERTAQVWMSQTPGRRRQAHSRTWEAPAATIYAAHGVPAIAVSPEPVRKRSRSQPQASAAEAPVADERAPVTVPVLQLAAADALAGEAQPQAQEV